MKKTAKRILSVFALGILLTSSEYVLASGSLRRSEAQEIKAESAAPEFTLQTIAGKSVALKDFKGKNVILFFFTTWCPYCRDKIPYLVKEYKHYQEQNIELLLIDVGESKTKVDAFCVKNNLPFDILLDSATKTADDYGVVGVPTFALVTKDGRVARVDNELPSNYAKYFE
ncbi:MAG: TlpA disulfide reductase family protein [Candidatus Omnitrophota bacterium]